MSVLIYPCSRHRLEIGCLMALATVLVSSSLWIGRVQAAGKPNIIFVLADDIGYGDLSCYGATKIQTPHCDRLAREGLRFTDAHAPAAVCTPTRYAFMTGEYAWRKKGTGILPGTAGLIVEPGRATVASVLKQAGYATAVIGKWHLGLGTTPTDYNRELRPGPLDIGFDYAWIIPATGDRTPCVWVENRRVVNLEPADPIRLDYSVQRGEPRSFVRGIPRIGEQIGGQAALWNDEEIADVLAAKSIEFIEKQAAGPFFLYLATHDIHVPRVPHPRFHGTSQAGLRGDAVHSFDWTVGKVLEALDRLQLNEQTLVIVTSDNGGTLDDNGPDVEHGMGTRDMDSGHLHNGPWRAGKGSAYEGGTRVPFIARWTGRIPSGTSDALLAHVDMLATLAALTGQSLSAQDAPDSFQILPALLTGAPGRDHLVEQGRTLALRQGSWKYLPAAGSDPVKGQAKGKKRKLDQGVVTQAELYHLGDDPGETKNLAREKTDIVRQLQNQLDRIQEQGRSRP